MTELEVRPTALLDELSRNGAFDHGLHLTDPDMTYEQLEAVGFLLGRHHTDVRLAMGDYLVLMEARFPEKFSQATSALGISEEGAMDYMRVARQVPKSVRRKGSNRIYFAHYRAVAALKVVDQETGEVTTDYAAQREWLDRVEREDLSHHQLRAELREGEPPASPNVCRCCKRPLP